MTEGPPSSPPSRPKRRPRYAGRNPRRFEEKYKERDPARYPEDVAKVIASGKTPAGTHRPVMVREVLEALAPRPGEVGVDATLGYGGHAVEILPRLLPGGRLYALDVDPLERPRAEARLRALGFDEDLLAVRATNFAGLPRLLREEGIRGVDFVLADLGVSSMQLDDPSRGFSWKREAPLDLRMNPAHGAAASALLARLAAPKLAALLAENADEPHAEAIAAAVVAARVTSASGITSASGVSSASGVTSASGITSGITSASGITSGITITSAIPIPIPIATTTALAEIVRGVLAGLPPRDRGKEGDGRETLARVFQALRIEVNDELAALDAFLAALPGCLAPGGRVAVLSFHSGEDRRVKKSFRQGQLDGLYASVSDEVVRPAPDEVRANPRSAPAKLRWAVRA